MEMIKFSKSPSKNYTRVQLEVSNVVVISSSDVRHVPIQDLHQHGHDPAPEHALYSPGKWTVIPGNTAKIIREHPGAFTRGQAKVKFIPEDSSTFPEETHGALAEEVTIKEKIESTQEKPGQSQIRRKKTGVFRCQFCRFKTRHNLELRKHEAVHFWSGVSCKSKFSDIIPAPDDNGNLPKVMILPRTEFPAKIKTLCGRKRGNPGGEPSNVQSFNCYKSDFSTPLESFLILHGYAHRAVYAGKKRNKLVCG